MSRLLIVSGVCLIIGGSIFGVALHDVLDLGFPWGAVTMISAGVWSLLTGMEMWIKKLVQ